MSKGKISVRRELRKPDAFVKTTYSALDYVKKHRKLASIAAVVLVAAGVTAFGSFWYINDHNQEARHLLNQAIEVIKLKPATTAAAESQPLETIITSYKGTTVGPTANYLSANEQYRSGKLDEALKVYQNSRKAAGGHLYDLQRLSAATIYFQQGKYTEAIPILEKMQAEQSFLNEDLYVLLGLSYEKSSQPEKAIATYENMVQLIQRSLFKTWAEEHLISLRNQIKS